MLTEFVVLLGKGRGGGSPLFGLGGYVLLNRVWFSGSSVINSFTIIVMGAKQNARNLLFTVLVWDSEPIRLLESPRLLSVNILNMKKLFECSQVHATCKYNWLVYNKSALCRSASPALSFVVLNMYICFSKCLIHLSIKVFQTIKINIEC